MEIIALLFIAFGLPPFGIFLILISTLGLRDLRPRRAGMVLGFSALLLIAGLYVFYVAPLAGDPLGDHIYWVEIATVGAFGIFTALAIVLLLPPPSERPRPMIYGYLGILCMAAGAAAFATVSQTNFAL